MRAFDGLLVLGQGKNLLEFLVAITAEIVIHGHGDLPEKYAWANLEIF